MAIAVAASAGYVVGTNETDHGIPCPSASSGDGLLFVMGFDQTRNVNSWGSWTQLFIQNGDADKSLIAGYRVSTGDEASVLTITLSGSEQAAAVTYHLTGSHTTTPPEADATGTSSTDTNPDPANLTPSWGAEENFWVAFYTNNTGSVTATTAPDSYSNLTQHHSASGPGTGNIAAAYRLLNATSDNPSVFTMSSSNAWRASIIAWRPAAGVAQDVTLPVSTATFTAQNLTAFQLPVASAQFAAQVPGVATKYLNADATAVFSSQDLSPGRAFELPVPEATFAAQDLQPATRYLNADATATFSDVAFEVFTGVLLPTTSATFAAGGNLQLSADIPVASSTFYTEFDDSDGVTLGKDWSATLTAITGTFSVAAGSTLGKDQTVTLNADATAAFSAQANWFPTTISLPTATAALTVPILPRWLPVATLSVDPQTFTITFPPWRNYTAGLRGHAFNTLSPQADGSGGVDFIATISTPGYWRVSSDTRLTVRLWELSTITSLVTLQGRP